MRRKVAADLRPGDVVDFTALDGLGVPIRTVARVEWHERGIPEVAVIVHWQEMLRPNTIRADKELAITRESPEES